MTKRRNKTADILLARLFHEGWSYKLWLEWLIAASK